MSEAATIEAMLKRLEAGEFILSRRHRSRTRTISVSTSGKEVKFGLPNLKGVAAWWLVLLNEGTASGGTDTRLYFAINDERDKTAVLADLVAGNGLYCAPGQSFEAEIAEDGSQAEPVIFHLQGVAVSAGPAYAAAAVKCTIAAFPLVRAKRE